MGLNLSETSIDLNREFVLPNSIKEGFADISVTDDVSQKLWKIYCLLHALEEEKKKIKVISSELPLALSLISDAMEKVRGEALKLKGKEKMPALEEFLPLKGNSDGDEGAKRSSDQGEKKNWMSSVVLWNHPVTYDDDSNPRKPSKQLFPTKPDGGDEGFQLFAPYKRKAAAAMKASEEEAAAAVKRVALPVHGLSLSPPSAVVDKGSNGSHSSSKMMNKQEQRKQRRCWSPELHQRFVNALDRLGGAQAATPKQIREIMNVDGLTNDEVKSHLQKYRLHVRRLTESPPPSTSTWPQLYSVSNNAVVMKAGSGALSGSPEGPLHLGLGAAREVSVTVTGLNAVEESEEEESVRGFDGH